MLKFVLTSIYLGLLICLLYQPLSIPDDDSMINKYRPSFQLHPSSNNAASSSEKNLQIVVEDLKIDSIALTKNHIVADSTP